MKVYIVTSGEYDDYGIENIFIDKQKAEHYVKHCSSAFNTDIEEYNTFDDNISLDNMYYWEVHCKYKLYKKDDGLYVKKDYNYSCLSYEKIEDKNHSCYYDLFGKDEWELEIERCYSQADYNKKQVEEKCEKEMMAMLSNLLEDISDNNGDITQDIVKKYF